MKVVSQSRSKFFSPFSILSKPGRLKDKVLTYALDTGRKLNTRKTFRRRPGHLLNVLCMFKIITVSRGSRVTTLPTLSNLCVGRITPY